MPTNRGSNTAWRRVRREVLERDGHVCQLQLEDCTFYATQVHHVADVLTGNDPDQLVAACKPCNLAAGNPAGKVEPEPKPNTEW